MSTHLDNATDRAAFRLSVDTWADFQVAIVCATMPKAGPHRASALRAIIGIKQRMLHSMSRDQALRTMESCRAALDKWLSDRKAT